MALGSILLEEITELYSDELYLVKKENKSSIILQHKR